MTNAINFSIWISLVPTRIRTELTKEDGIKLGEFSKVLLFKYAENPTKALFPKVLHRSMTTFDISVPEETNTALWLATPVDEISISCLLGTTRYVPTENFPRNPCNNPFIDHSCTVTMVGYCLDLFSFWVIIGPWPLTWPQSSSLFQALCQCGRLKKWRAGSGRERGGDESNKRRDTGGQTN